MNKYQDLLHRRLLQSPSQQVYGKRTTFKFNSNDWKSFDFNNLGSSSQDIPQVFSPLAKDSSERLLKKSSISDFSMKQNEVIKNFINPLMLEYSKTVRLPEINKPKLPSELDFNNLIENINEITSPKDIYRTCVILDQDPIDLQIPEGKTRYLQVFTKGKKAPLSLKIKKRKGRILVFSSFSSSEPETAFDVKTFTNDYIEIRDSNLHFSSESLFLAVKAVQTADFTLTLSFGKQISSLAELRRMKRSLVQLPSSEDPEDSLEKREKAEKSPSRKMKNFIKANKISKLVNFDTKVSLLSERAENWKLKHEQVLMRKKEILFDKKKKNLEFLNRQKLKKAQEKVKLQETTEKNQKRKHCESWLTLIYFSKLTQNLRSFIKEKKKWKLRTAELLESVVTIQRIYRRFKGQLPSRDIATLRSRNLLRFYHDNLQTIERKFHSGKVIITSIHFIAHTQLVFHHFTTFCKSVCRIQRFMRKYFSIKERKIEALVKLWNMVSENMSFRSGEKLRESISLIPKAKRDKKLFSFYENYRKTLRKNSRDFSESVKTFTENRIFQTALSGLFQKSDFSDFLPSTRQMEKMILNVLQDTQ
jgi:hypothetical protein